MSRYFDNVQINLELENKCKLYYILKFKSNDYIRSSSMVLVMEKQYPALLPLNDKAVNWQDMPKHNPAGPFQLSKEMKTVILPSHQAIITFVPINQTAF